MTVERGGTLDASNFVGKTCDEATQVIQEAMGDVETRVNKKEYMYERARVNVVG